MIAAVTSSYFHTVCVAVSAHTRPQFFQAALLVCTWKVFADLMAVSVGLAVEEKHFSIDVFCTLGCLNAADALQAYVNALSSDYIITALEN